MKRALIGLVALCCFSFTALAGEATWVAYPAFPPMGDSIWSYGYLTWFWRDEVALFSPKGELLFRTRIEVPEATRVVVRTASAAPGGMVAAVVYAEFGTNETWNEFIAWIGASGKQTRLVRMYTGRGKGMPAAFIPRHVAVSADAVWVLGSRRDYPKVLGNRTDEGEKYETLAKYSLEGALMGAFLPRSLFPDEGDPSWDIGDPRTDPRICTGAVSADHARAVQVYAGCWPQTRIIANAGGVGILASATQEWVELTAGGELIGRWSYAGLMDRGRGLRGVALTPSGEVYAMFRGQSLHGESPAFTLFKLDRERSAWDLVVGSLAATIFRPSQFGALLGADDSGLIFQFRGAFPYGQREQASPLPPRDTPLLVHWHP